MKKMIHCRIQKDTTEQFRMVSYYLVIILYILYYLFTFYDLN